MQGLVDGESLRVHRIIEGIAINWPIGNVLPFLDNFMNIIMDLILRNTKFYENVNNFEIYRIK